MMAGEQEGQVMPQEAFWVIYGEVDNFRFAQTFRWHMGKQSMI